MFGLGGQEILLLGCCTVVPLAAVGLAFALGRLSARKTTRDDSGTTTDFDDPNS